MPAEFEFSEDLLELRAMVREFCQEFSPEATVRTTMESPTGLDSVLWRRLGSELGVLGLAVPEALGGAEAGLVYQAIVAEELGASLLCGPVLGTVYLAIPALCALTDEAAKRDYLPSLVSGEKVATLAAPVVDGQLLSNAVTVSATREGDGWALTGSLAQVPDGGSADLVLVAARTQDGLALFAVDGSAAGLTCTDLVTMDLTRRQADLELVSVAARMIADETTAPAVCERAVLVATALLAAEQVGGSQRMLDVTVAHVSSRIQFGQPVGAYQAVKHRCANMLMALEQARSAAYHAVWALEDGTDDARLSTSLAKTVASESFAWISTSAIQMHGGLGFTWEGTPQLYFKRATTDLLTLGTPEQHVEHIARFALDGVTA